MIFKSDSMNLNFKNAVGYLTFKELEKYSFVNHAFSTRLGGVSKNEFKSLNLGFRRADVEENVIQNYRIFCDTLGFDLNRLAKTCQVHENKIKVVKEQDFLSADDLGVSFKGVDGLVTNVRGAVLTAFHADCPAVFMIDPVKKAVGLAHAGWRGTVAKIAENLLNSFEKNYNSSKKDIICAVGPGIGKCCFEVSDSVLPFFESLSIKNEAYITQRAKSKMHIDLIEVNSRILLNAGAKAENIFKSDVCSACCSDILFSHRKTFGKRGNNASFISLR